MTEPTSTQQNAELTMSTVISPTLVLPWLLRKAFTFSCMAGTFCAMISRRSVLSEEYWARAMAAAIAPRGHAFCNIMGVVVSKCSQLLFTCLKCPKLLLAHSLITLLSVFQCYSPFQKIGTYFNRICISRPTLIFLLFYTSFYSPQLVSPSS